MKGRAVSEFIATAIIALAMSAPSLAQRKVPALTYSSERCFDLSNSQASEHQTLALRCSKGDIRSCRSLLANDAAVLGHSDCKWIFAVEAALKSLAKKMHADAFRFAERAIDYHPGLAEGYIIAALVLIDQGSNATPGKTRDREREREREQAAAYLRDGSIKNFTHDWIPQAIRWLEDVLESNKAK